MFYIFAKTSVNLIIVNKFPACAMKTIKYLYALILLCTPLFSYANCKNLVSTLQQKFYPHYQDSGLNITRCKVWSADPSKTIVVFIEDNGIKDASFNLDVMLVNSQSGEVIARKKEKNAIQRENELINLSAGMLVQLDIDTEPYKLNQQVSAFGIRIYYDYYLSGTQYYAQYLNLYTFQNNNLTRVINNLEVEHSIFNEEKDPIHLNWIGGIDKLIVTLSLSQNHTNGFADIIVSEKRDFITSENSHSKCVLPKRAPMSECVPKGSPKYVFILHYDGKKYVIPKRHDIQYKFERREKTLY